MSNKELPVFTRVADERIAELEAELAELREAARDCIKAESYGCGFAGNLDWVEAFERLALLQEKGE